MPPLSRLIQPQPRTAPAAGPPASTGVIGRARLLWPGLDARRLARTNGDPRAVARLVARRSGLPYETLLAMLGRESSTVR